MADSAGPKRDTSVYLGQAASKLNSELKTFLQVSNGLINNPSMKEAKQTMQAKNAVVKECTMVLKALEEYEERTRQRYETNPSKQGASLSGETVQALRNALGLR